MQMNWTISLLLPAGFFMLGWFAQQIRSEATEKIAIINDHIKDIEKFATLAQDYWLSTAHSDEIDIQASKVRAALFPISRHYGSLSEGYARGINRKLYVRLNRVATGGTFQTASRVVDHIRAEEVVDICSQIIYENRQTRRWLASIKGTVFSQFGRNHQA